MKFWGVDPGKKGGIAVIDERGNVIDADPMPETDREILDLFRCCDGCSPREGRCDGEHFAVIELVPIVPKNGALSSFHLGGSYRSLRLAMVAAGIRMDEARPRRWKKELGLLTSKKLTDAKKKALGREKAQQLFPRVEVTDEIADALLLAEYARRIGTTGEAAALAVNNTPS